MFCGTLAHVLVPPTCGTVQVGWLRRHVERIPVRLVFESALELMACNKVR